MGVREKESSFGRLPLPGWLKPIASAGLVASSVSLFFAIYPNCGWGEPDRRCRKLLPWCRGESRS